MCCVGAKSIILQVWFLLGGRDPKIEGCAGALDAQPAGVFVQKGIPLRTSIGYLPTPSKQTLRPDTTADPFPDTLMTAIDRTAYASLIANAVMLSNVADLTEVLSTMAKDGHPVTAALAASISPYIREHIRRFGRFVLI